MVHDTSAASRTTSRNCDGAKLLIPGVNGQGPVEQAFYQGAEHSTEQDTDEKAA
jgi:hypothetical protein